LIRYTAVGGNQKSNVSYGKIVFFTRSNGKISTILMGKLQGDHWTAPVVAPFSGEWDDLEPAIAPAGSFVPRQDSLFQYEYRPAGFFSTFSRRHHHEPGEHGAWADGREKYLVRIARALG